MFKEKKINYAIGILFIICLLGFFALPLTNTDVNPWYAGSIYKIIPAAISAIFTPAMWQIDPFFMTALLCMFFVMIISGLILILALTGFILKFTSLKNSKFENIISWIYSVLFPILILCLIVTFLPLYSLVTDPEVKLKPFIGFYLLVSTTILISSFAVIKIRKIVLSFCIILLLFTLGTTFASIF